MILYAFWWHLSALIVLLSVEYDIPIYYNAYAYWIKYWWLVESYYEFNIVYEYIYAFLDANNALS